MRAAVIIAGGRSTRFGDADKAVADLAGVPMTRRVADRLVTVVDRVVVNCRADQRDALERAMAGYPLPVAYAVDPDPDEGPMAGIRTGVRAVAAGADEASGNGAADPDAYALVVACDMPFVDPEFVDYLFERAAGHEAAVPQLDDEWFQTTQAVYRAGPMADACEAALDAGERKILAPLERLEWVVVDDAEIRARTTPETFENCNTRAEFEAATERLAADDGGDGGGDRSDGDGGDGHEGGVG
ncbi:molybdenum cofactor guanylyltransferase [Halobium salinum]|uniref:Molybdenum cofactor guanylyltransferase n=1 Tax=Halobium salinum TaxID=1364940 RepID=A0ABD5PD03_9EURY|nr:molybdenum cofactor guanylyltransferase [Halobium salinum]